MIFLGMRGVRRSFEVMVTVLQVGVCALEPCDSGHRATGWAGWAQTPGLLSKF